MRHSRAAASPLRSIRHQLHRARSRWIVTAVVSAIALSWTFSTVTNARSERTAWGKARSVPVALNELSPGRVISAADIEFVDRPVAVLPQSIAESPIGRTVSRTIVNDEVIVEERLAGGARTGPAALLEENTIAFAIAVENATPPVGVGDHVALFAPSEVVATATRGTGPAMQVAENAIVVAVTEQTVTVAVDKDDAPVLARALLTSTVVVALVS